MNDGLALFISITVPIVCLFVAYFTYPIAGVFLLALTGWLLGIIDRKLNERKGKNF